MRYSSSCRGTPSFQSWHRGRVNAHLGAGNGLDPLFLGGPSELHGTVEPVVVRESECRIPQLLRPQDQLLRVGGAVQKGEARVGVELDVGGGHGFLPLGYRINTEHKMPSFPSETQGVPVLVRFRLEAWTKQVGAGSPSPATLLQGRRAAFPIPLPQPIAVLDAETLHLAPLDAGDHRCPNDRDFKGPTTFRDS